MNDKITNLQNLEEQFKEMTSSPKYINMAANKMTKDINDYINTGFEIPKIPDPEERLKFLTDKLDSMNSELETQTKSMHKIQYENMKLNAQIEVLNKTLDSSRDELFELQKANAELKAVNKNLENSNRHYWRNTGLISLGVAIVSFVLGLFSTEARVILLSVLNIFQ